ncbi:MAG: hypothetical protein ABR564_06630 [Candidatus Dormibacteria bacterium]
MGEPVTLVAQLTGSYPRGGCAPPQGQELAAGLSGDAAGVEAFWLVVWRDARGDGVSGR